MKKTKKPTSLFAINFNYCGIECDYDKEYNCDEAGCDMICRCAKIIGEEITSINLIAITEYILSNFMFKKDISTIDIYCVERILRYHGLHNKDAFYISVERGYYGDEINEITISHNANLESDIFNYLKLKTNKEKIEFVLNMEYKNLLPELKNRKWTIKTIPTKVLSTNKEYNNMIKRSNSSQYDGWTLPLGIALDNGNKTYRLIDGYHRVSSSHDEKIKMIVGK